MTTLASTDNPMGTDGFEFLEFTTTDEVILTRQFEAMGFTKIAKHRSKSVFLFRQNQINFILNVEPDTLAHEFAKAHGPACCAMGFRIKDAKLAYQRALDLGATPYETPIGPNEVKIPAIYGIGGSLIYFVDTDIYETDFEYYPAAQGDLYGQGLIYIDHLTHNLAFETMDDWAENFYFKLFNFRQIRYFDIKGKKTGLISRALSSPCNKIKIPLNEGTEKDSQIEEFLREFNGPGIQHIALTTENIYETVEGLNALGNAFLDVPDTYYEMLDERVPQHGEDLPRLQKNKILLDGSTQTGEGTLLQIFTDTMLGPVFFEVIQRQGNEGFGEGNFQALFEAIERDQMRRGVLQEDECRH